MAFIYGRHVFLTASVFCRVGFGYRDTFTDAPYYGRVILYSKRDPNGDDLAARPFDNIDPQAYIIWFDKVVQAPWTNSVASSLVTVKKTWRPYEFGFHGGFGGACTGHDVVKRFEG